MCFRLLVYIVVLVLVFCLCPSSVRVVATLPGTVLVPFSNFLIITDIKPYYVQIIAGFSGRAV